MEKKIENLIAFAQGIYKGEKGKDLYDKYLADINTITPQEVFLVENEQLKMGLTPKELLPSVDKLMNVFYNSLEKYHWERPKEGSFVYYLIKENEGLTVYLDELKEVIKRQNYESDKGEILIYLMGLKAYNEHLLKLENVLFPYMEKKKERFEGLKIMWSLHDEVRANLNKLISKFEAGDVNYSDINKDIGDLFFGHQGLIQKQEVILFPASSELFDENEFFEMHMQSFDYEFPFIETPEKPEVKLSDVIGDGIIKMGTGSFTFEQIECMINTLPVDITFVNERDKVGFFSKPDERFFPRSVAIIGRDVRNCHPPESVHVVEKILENFKLGKRDKESFWIKMADKFILIQYFAVRNKEGKYLGTLEVGQEISEIRNLEGEKRLLDDE